MPESDLYAPVKRFLEEQGYRVKGEIGGCDVLAVRNDDEQPLVVELKQAFNLTLLLQAVDRLAITEHVYVAFRTGASGNTAWRKQRRRIVSLLRRVGIGVLTVSPDDVVRAVLDPVPYHPRANVRRRRRLLREFTRRVGDPESGGSSVRRRLTAYRQDALRCARVLADEQVMKASELRDRTGVSRAGSILSADHYGWFERVSRGHYRLSPRGERELQDWREAVLERRPKT